jgi:ribosome small subunit-dependent GTPase A
VPHPLAAHGWDDRVAALFAAVDDDRNIAGRVVRVDRGSCLVATADGVVRASPYGETSRLSGVVDSPVTGDWVAIVDASASDRAGADWALVAILTRSSAVSRKLAEDRVAAEQILVANVDFLGLVLGLDWPVAPNRVERMLAAAWESGAVPVLVLTKADAVADAAERVGEIAAFAGDVSIHATSVVTGEGVDALRALVQPARTLALIGASGAGKSSLVNVLAGSDVQSTGAVREADRRGRHTTTSRDLLVLPTGGVVIDTPGLRSLALWDAAEGVAQTFTDIDELAHACRFGDCGHHSEPGCAVVAATASGAIPRRRLASYHKLQDELELVEARRVEQSWRPTGVGAGSRSRKR